MPEFLLTSSSAFGLVALAELGDKSQLLCITLATRNSGVTVFACASLAFAVLNLLAVVFGAALAAWLPLWLIAGSVAILFTVFGLQALHSSTNTAVTSNTTSSRTTFLTLLLLIFLSELGDKTQLTVAGLASDTAEAVPVWLGSTLALMMTSALAVLLGHTLLQRIPLPQLQRLCGLAFLLMALVFAWRSVAAR